MLAQYNKLMEQRRYLDGEVADLQEKLKETVFVLEDTLGRPARMPAGRRPWGQGQAQEKD